MLKRALVSSLLGKLNVIQCSFISQWETLCLCFGSWHWPSSSPWFMRDVTREELTMSLLEGWGANANMGNYRISTQLWAEMKTLRAVCGWCVTLKNNRMGKWQLQAIFHPASRHHADRTMWWFIFQGDSSCFSPHIIKHNPKIVYKHTHTHAHTHFLKTGRWVGSSLANGTMNPGLVSLPLCLW